MLQVLKENVAAEDNQVPQENILAEVTQDRKVFKQSVPAEDPHEKIDAKTEKDQLVSRSDILADAEHYPAYKEKRQENAFDHDGRTSKHNTTNSHDDSGYSSKSNITYNQDDSASSIKHNTTNKYDDSACNSKHITTYGHDDSSSGIKHSTAYAPDGSASDIKHSTAYDHEDTVHSSMWNDVSKLRGNSSANLDNDVNDSSKTWGSNIHYTQDKPFSMPNPTSLGFSPGDYIPSKAGIPEEYSPNKIGGMYVCAVKGCYQVEQYLNTMYTHIRRYHAAPLRCIPCRNLFYSADGIKKHMKTVHGDGVTSNAQGGSSYNYGVVSGRISGTISNYNDISAVISMSRLVSTPVKPTAFSSMISPDFSPGDYVHTKAGISSTPQKAGGQYYCPHCSHTEKYLNTLYTHIRREHSGPLLCSCGKQYYSAQGLKQHIKNKH